MKDEDDEDKAEVQFTSLDWGQEYCVSLKVAGNGGEFTSELSPEQCLLLPEQGNTTQTTQPYMAIYGSTF